MTISTSNLNLLALVTVEEIASSDRPSLRKLYREALGQPADRTVMDRSSQMRQDLLAAKASLETPSVAEEAPVEIVADVACEIEATPQAPIDMLFAALDELQGADLACETQVVAEPTEAVEEKARRGSKWSSIVAELWAMRDGEDAVEVKISVETLTTMGLPLSATKHAVYWSSNPPGIAAREMGLVTSLRKGENGQYLLIRKADAPVSERSSRAQQPKTEKTQEGAASKWNEIVKNLWSMRDGEDAVEVKISAEQLLGLGLPASAVRHPAYWGANPPGRAARAMGLMASLRRDGDQSYLLIRKA